MRNFILIMMAALVLVATCHAAVDDDAEGNTPMSFTIEIRLPSGDGFDSKVAGRFTDVGWSSLWNDLEITRDKWEDWQSEQENVPLMADLPEVSKLAYIDEGVVHFSPKELNKECVRLMPALSSDSARQLIKSLLEACEIAIQDEDADLVVHPFPA